MYHPATTPSQYLHPRTPNPYRIHCGRWKHEQDREAYSRSAATNLVVLAGAPIDIFLSYLRRADRSLLLNNHARFQLDRPPKKTPRPIPAGPVDRFALVGTQLWKVFLRHRACAGPDPPPPEQFDGKWSRMSAKCRWIKKHPLWRRRNARDDCRGNVENRH